jgi:hypothetical protein
MTDAVEKLEFLSQLGDFFEAKTASAYLLALARLRKLPAQASW